MWKHSRLIANILILLSLCGVTGAMWAIYRAANVTFDPWLLAFAAGGVIAIGLLFSLAFNFAAKLLIAAIAFATVLAAYAGNHVLELTGRNLLHIFDATVARQQIPVAPPPADPAPVTATAQTPSPATRKPTVHFQATYDAYGQTSAVIPETESLARVSDGASILGYSFVPANNAGTIEISVQANAYAQTDNGLVVAIFQTGRAQPLKLARIALRAGERGFLETSVRVSFITRGPMTLDVRVGPSRPGTIYINGDATGKQTVPRLPGLTITETPDAAAGTGNPSGPAIVDAAILPAPTLIGGTWQQQFSGPAETDSVMAAALSALDTGQGLKVLGFDMQGATRSGNLRVRVAMNALSHTDNELRIGLFRGDGSVPAGLATARLLAGKTTHLIKSFDLENVKSTESLRVHAGPGRPGNIFLNGDGKGGRQKMALYPVLIVVERDLATTDTPFPDDDGTVAFARTLNLVQPHSDPSPAGRNKVSCRDAFAGPDTGVFLAFGQSQAANTGIQKYESQRDVINFNFLDSGCYAAKDPLLGASNLMGSVWSRLGDLLIDSGAYRRVVVAPIAVGGTFLSEWMPGGKQHHRLSLALQRLNRAEAKVAGFLWQQGEAEAGRTDMSVSEYKSGFLEMLASIRAQGFSAPVYVAVSTYCGALAKRNAENIRRALQELAAENADILPGPDTDAIGVDQRHDGCHFDGPGQDRAADMWADAIRAR
ncbi:MAG: sialate O-acetylesterase [Alphaproteobacteria bacterium]